MKTIVFVLLIWGILVAAVPHVSRSTQPKDKPDVLDFSALRNLKPKESTNQYFNWFDNIFEDHWGNRFDVEYWKYVEGILNKGWNNSEIYRKRDRCKEEVTPTDPDPDYVTSPQDNIVATPIFCDSGVVVLVQYNPASGTPEGLKEGRNVSCMSYVFRAYGLAAAINNKWYPDTGTFNPMFKGRKAIPGAPDSLSGKVYNERIKFQWEAYREVDLQVIGRTRWSEDQTEWIILALLHDSEYCPFRPDAFIDITA
ncbi:hypothetical protein TWF281_006658 [Arthrobotrys megalospora]